MDLTQANLYNAACQLRLKLDQAREEAHQDELYQLRAKLAEAYRALVFIDLGDRHEIHEDDCTWSLEDKCSCGWNEHEPAILAARQFVEKEKQDD